MAGQSGRASVRDLAFPPVEGLVNQTRDARDAIDLPPVVVPASQKHLFSVTRPARIDSLNSYDAHAHFVPSVHCLRESQPIEGWKCVPFTPSPPDSRILVN